MIGKGHRAVKIEAEDHHQQGKRHGRAEQRAEIRASFPILPLGEIVEGADKREDADVLRIIRETLAHLEINGPNAIIAMLPDGRMMTCCDSKKLRPVVVGHTDTMLAISSEVCGLNAVMPDRDVSTDIYPGERETIVIDNDLRVHICRQ